MGKYFLTSKGEVEAHINCALYYSGSLEDAKRLVEARLANPAGNGVIEPVKHDDLQITWVQGNATAKVRVYLGENQDKVLDIEVKTYSPHRERPRASWS